VIFATFKPSLPAGIRRKREWRGKMSINTPGSGEGAPRAAPANPIVPKTAQEALRPEIGTPPPKRSRASRNQIVVFMNFMISLVMLVILAGGAALYFGKQEFGGTGPSTVPATFLVKPSTGVQDIADQLERRGLISDARVFRMGVRAYGNDGALKAGEYEIQAGASMHDIMELLKSGKSVQYSLTIPEGLTVEQAWKRIADNEALSGDMPADMPPRARLPPTRSASHAGDAPADRQQDAGRPEGTGRRHLGSDALPTCRWPTSTSS
jgi:UPF0755 protein